MNKSTLLQTSATAHLLITRINTVLELSNKEVADRERHNANPNKHFTYAAKPDLIVSNTKANGAVRRISMELSRLLTDLRQNR
jgi:hypothetical protein